MASELIDRGWEVYGCDIAWATGTPIGRRVSPVQVDALKVFSEHTDKYDLTIHAAYHVGGRAGIDGNRGNLARNMQLDAAMFDWAVRTGQPRVLYFSSSAVYPKRLQNPDSEGWWPQGRPIRLSEDMGGWTWTNPVDNIVGLPDADYGWAKLCGERLACNAREQGVKVHVLRPFSGTGVGQGLEYPFPAIVDRVRRGDFTVWGPKGQCRDWVSIRDVVCGALAVVAADCQEPVNLCTGQATEFGTLVKEIADQLYEAEHGLFPPLGLEPEVVYDEAAPTGVMFRVGDPKRMLDFYTPQDDLHGIIESFIRAKETGT